MKKYNKKQTRRTLNANGNFLESDCFFCDEVDIDKSNQHNGTLQIASTMGLHSNRCS